MLRAALREIATRQKVTLDELARILEIAPEALDDMLAMACRHGRIQRRLVGCGGRAIPGACATCPATGHDPTVVFEWIPDPE
ncbi:MAG: FeoC-like transcriptional regulator [Candidatus Marinimicrobia bacterium]|nr:FeoC-like transcriptional regulator [Candidatus Neomarinimicrobiota bacterium]